jgi:DNA repair protein RadA/Sms
MAARTQNYVCQNCGAAYVRWSGRCEACGEWNTLVEEGAAASSRASRKGRLFSVETLKGESQDAPRISSGVAEFDRVTGGGLVPGSVLLLGGDPGIGKSTLLLEVTAALARARHRTVYISGEEAVAQIRLRAERLGLTEAAVEIAAETSVEDIVATLSQGAVPRLLVIDSIQTMWTQKVEAAPGTVTQVRGSAGELIRFAKRTGAAVILVGHVTKDGQIAGPRVVEHMVDAVLSFEGEGSHQFRILRAIKNRFGPTDEIGVFEMTGGGLREVANPSELFLSERDLGSPGTAVFAGIEGTRPVLVEIQALVAPTTLGTPRRAVVGWDQSRLSMVLAVLEAHCGVRRSRTHRYRLTRSISARYRCPAPCGPWRRPRPGSRKHRNSALPARSYRRFRAPKPRKGFRWRRSTRWQASSPILPKKASKPEPVTVHRRCGGSAVRMPNSHTPFALMADNRICR